VAWKFPAKLATTRILGIDWSVGRSGVVSTKWQYMWQYKWQYKPVSYGVKNQSGVAAVHMYSW
jgi:hypothetical protein